MVKKVLITGASEGIGKQFARAFADEGYQVYLLARNRERLESVARDLPGEGHEIFTADLSIESGVAVVGELIGKIRFDVLVNNAGFGGLGEFHKGPLELNLQMIQLNVQSLVTISHLYLQTAEAGSALINVASVLSYLPAPYHSVYAGTKAFVKSFSEGLWFEQKRRGVYVMTLCPGATSTEFNVRAGGSSDRIPKILLQSPKAVVDEAMHELKMRAKPVVVTGRINKLIRFISNLIPQKVLIRANGKQAFAKLPR